MTTSLEQAAERTLVGAVDHSRNHVHSRGSAGSELARRVFDIVFALLVLVLSAPILALAMLAIQLDSPGPALFRQRRMGRGGRLFQLIKLRGMYIDARQRFPHLYDYSSMQADDRGSFYFHQQEDPRVTRVGRFLRKYSIDELPNFWNVLRGDMSVVGPRPEIPELAHMYEDRKLARILSVRPGVTSPAKASGRDGLSLEDTIDRDLAYIENRSLRVDLVTILQTAGNVVRGRGVC
jgi:lipopolysaccharide/colanic/teichoic acid biosynthesis glycosyltransferase